MMDRGWQANSSGQGLVNKKKRVMLVSTEAWTRPRVHSNEKNCWSLLINSHIPCVRPTQAPNITLANFYWNTDGGTVGGDWIHFTAPSNQWGRPRSAAESSARGTRWHSFFSIFFFVNGPNTLLRKRGGLGRAGRRGWRLISRRNPYCREWRLGWSAAEKLLLHLFSGHLSSDVGAEFYRWHSEHHWTDRWGSPASFYI